MWIMAHKLAKRLWLKIIEIKLLMKLSENSALYALKTLFIVHSDYAIFRFLG